MRLLEDVGQWPWASAGVRGPGYHPAHYITGAGSSGEHWGTSNPRAVRCRIHPAQPAREGASLGVEETARFQAEGSEAPAGDPRTAGHVARLESASHQRDMSGRSRYGRACIILQIRRSPRGGMPTTAGLPTMGWTSYISAPLPPLCAGAPLAGAGGSPRTHWLLCRQGCPRHRLSDRRIGVLGDSSAEFSEDTSCHQSSVSRR
jgi:hypothetical protein